VLYLSRMINLFKFFIIPVALFGANLAIATSTDSTVYNIQSLIGEYSANEFISVSSEIQLLDYPNYLSVTNVYLVNGEDVEKIVDKDSLTYICGATHDECLANSKTYNIEGALHYGDSILVTLSSVVDSRQLSLIKRGDEIQVSSESYHYLPSDQFSVVNGGDVKRYRLSDTKLLLSTDFGVSWDLVHDFKDELGEDYEDSSFDWNVKIYFFSENNWVVELRSSKLFGSSDYGETWDLIASDIPGNLAVFSDSSWITHYGSKVGLARDDVYGGYSSSVVISTKDSGVTYQRILDVTKFKHFIFNPPQLESFGGDAYTGGNVVTPFSDLDFSDDLDGFTSASKELIYNRFINEEYIAHETFIDYGYDFEDHPDVLAYGGNDAVISTNNFTFESSRAWIVNTNPKAQYHLQVYDKSQDLWFEDAHWSVEKPVCNIGAAENENDAYELELYLLTEQGDSSHIDITIESPRQVAIDTTYFIVSDTIFINDTSYDSIVWYENEGEEWIEIAKNQDYFKIDSTKSTILSFEIFEFDCSAKSEEIVVERIALGLNADTEINIYPNPTMGLLRIDCQDCQKMVEIYSLDGRLVYDGNRLDMIDLHFLDSGVYFLRYIDKNNQILVQKIIRE
ncbi:MAG: hypothetical protein CMB80_19965, partial [Flammeovirgaceae bacterium]|nr:hypothetical protein [Flammeovirgaceae bacterium]